MKRRIGFWTVAAALVPAAMGLGAERPLGDLDANKGKAIFLRECAACHGERGDGKGLATPFLSVRPRNFLRGEYRFRTTPAGQPPATNDVLRVIERGIPGSAMPSFDFLSEAERKQVAAFVLRLGDLLDTPEPAPMPDPGDGPPATDATRSRGKEIYTSSGTCFICHGNTGAGDGPVAPTTVDLEGNRLPPRDFTAGIFHCGDTRKEIYYEVYGGMNGTPMGSFAAVIPVEADRWALLDFVLSLRKTPPAKPLPTGAIEAGRAVATKYSCRGCHVLDDGKGAEVGPDLRVSGQKLDSDWIRHFLADPRRPGKIYPGRPARMPRLALSQAEIETLVAYVASMGKRAPGPASAPDPATLAAGMVENGKNTFVLRCAQCHALGKIVETPLASQQGPDLIHVAGRVDYRWAQDWILDPQKIYPGTKMTTAGVTPEEAAAVRAFVWNSSLETPPPR